LRDAAKHIRGSGRGWRVFIMAVRGRDMRRFLPGGVEFIAARKMLPPWLTFKYIDLNDDQL
jgi:hypothetical protein